MTNETRARTGFRIKPRPGIVDDAKKELDKKAHGIQKRAENTGKRRILVGWKE
jgi:hypothetical protein